MLFCDYFIMNTFSRTITWRTQTWLVCKEFWTPIDMHCRNLICRVQPISSMSFITQHCEFRECLFSAHNSCMAKENISQPSFIFQVVRYFNFIITRYFLQQKTTMNKTRTSKVGAISKAQKTQTS